MRRPRALALALIGTAVALGATTIALKLWIEATESRRWEEMRDRLAQLAAEARSRDPGRTVLRGAPTPGNAWQDYDPALLTLKSMDWMLVLEFLDRNPQADPAKVRAWVDQSAPALQGLRRGVTRTHLQRDIEREATLPARNPVTALSALSRCRARFLAESGKAREAVELLLDTAQFAEDSARHGALADALTGASILSTVLEDLKPLLVSGGLSPGELLDASRELDLLDRTYPSEGDAFVNDARLIGLSFLSSGNAKKYFEEYFGQNRKAFAGRYGFSDRIMMADAFETYLRLMERMKAARQRPWREAAAINRECLAQWREDSNPLLRALYDIYGYPSAQNWVARDRFREVRAQLRLIRMAAHYRATGALLDLEDPYGAKLLFSRKGSRATLWSVGEDGTDDGGVGDWKSGGRDLRLDVER